MSAIADGSSLEVEKSTHMRMSLLFCYYQVKLRMGGDHVNVTWPLNRGGAILYSGGSNEPPDFQKKKNYIHKIFTFF